MSLRYKQSLREIKAYQIVRQERIYHLFSTRLRHSVLPWCCLEAVTKKPIEYQKQNGWYHRSHRQVRGELKLQLILGVRHIVQGGTVHCPELVHPVPADIYEEVPGEKSSNGEVVEEDQDQVMRITWGRG